MSRVGEAIRNARQTCGMSSKQLAKKLGVSESFVSDVESGKKIINEALIKRVEKLLNVELNESSFEEVSQPVENIKDIEVKSNINKQWEEAFSHILKKIPVCDINFKEIYDYKYLPVMDKKIYGFSSDKVVYINVPDDSMRGFRLYKNDKVMVYQTGEITNNSISIVEIEGKRYIRQIKRLDSNKVLLISHFTDLKTETREVKTFSVIGRCIKVEIDL